MTASITLLASRVIGIVVGIDDLLLRIPFRGDGLGDLAGRRSQQPPRGRAHRLAVESNAKTLGRFGDAGLRVKALAPRSARGAPDRLLRIERRMAGDFIE